MWGMAAVTWSCGVKEPQFGEVSLSFSVFSPGLQKCVVRSDLQPGPLETLFPWAVSSSSKESP